MTKDDLMSIFKDIPAIPFPVAVKNPALLAMAEAVGDVRVIDGRRFVIEKYKGLYTLVDAGDTHAFTFTRTPSTLSVQEMIDLTMRADDDERLWKDVCKNAPEIEVIIIDPLIVKPEPLIIAVVTEYIYPSLPTPAYIMGFDMNSVRERTYWSGLLKESETGFITACDS